MVNILNKNINFITDEIIEEIGKINGIQVQRQFGNNKIAAVNLRITRGITVEDLKKI
jgi:lipoate-protein ligase B